MTSFFHGQRLDSRAEDRTSDKEDLIQPGIIQLELRVGQLYVYPDWVQTMTYPFDGEGQRQWIGATVRCEERAS